MLEQIDAKLPSGVYKQVFFLSDVRLPHELIIANRCRGVNPLVSAAMWSLSTQKEADFFRNTSYFSVPSEEMLPFFALKYFPDLDWSGGNYSALKPVFEGFVEPIEEQIRLAYDSMKSIHTSDEHPKLQRVRSIWRFD